MHNVIIGYVCLHVTHFHCTDGVRKYLKFIIANLQTPSCEPLQNNAFKIMHYQNICSRHDFTMPELYFYSPTGHRDSIVLIQVTFPLLHNNNITKRCVYEQNYRALASAKHYRIFCITC